MIFEYTVNVDSDEPIMLINQHIGLDDDGNEGIMGAKFERELLMLDTMGKKLIKVYINSIGGGVIDGMSIYQAIINSKVAVDTYCTGIAASIAGVVFQAGKNRIMSDYGVIMMHDPSGGSKKTLGVFKEAIITMIQRGCGLSNEAISDLMKRESWITAKEAFELNLCTQVENSTFKNLDTSNITMAWQEANTILNKTLPIKQISKMEDLKKINNKLGLNEEASSESTLKAIEEVMNASTHMKGKLKEMEDALNAKKLECENAEKAYNDFKTKMDDKDKAENEFKAENMVLDAIKVGKIKLESKDSWKNLAVIDFEGAKNALEGIAVNAKAVRIADVANNTKDPFAGATSAALEMARIANRLKIKLS